MCFYIELKSKLASHCLAKNTSHKDKRSEPDSD